MNDCPFCQPDRDVVLSTELSLCFHDKFPVSEGHLLIVPKRHVPDYFELTDEEKKDLWKLVEQAKAYLEEKHNPDGINIGFNSGTAAGQTIFHVHIHVIPRYTGDVEDPTGGIRNVIPGKGKY